MDPSLETHYEPIDDQHRALFVLFGQTLEAVEAKQDERLTGLLRELFVAVLDHFSFEERLMRERAYAGQRAHFEAHGLFMSDFARLCSEAEQKGVTPGVRLWVTSRFARWFVTHTRNDDAALGRFLKASPAPAAAPQ